METTAQAIHPDHAPPRRRQVRLPLPGGRSLRFSEEPGVHPLDPYAPSFAAALAVRRGARVLDLGCGAGGYGLAAAARGAARVLLTDVCADAVRCALRNAALNGLPAVEGRVGSLFEPVRRERFDLIVSTLPQLPAPGPLIETRYGGPDGLEFLRLMAREAPRHLAPGGRVNLLVTDWPDPRQVLPLFHRRGFRARLACRVERPFQPADYDRLRPGLFQYLDRRARAGRGRYRRAGSWCYLGVSLFELALP